MPAWLLPILLKLKTVPWNKIPWGKLWLAATWLGKAGKSWLQKNLTAEERQELAYLMTRSKGKKSNLTPREQKRFAELVRKAFFGRGGSGGSPAIKRRQPRKPRPGPASA